MVRRKLVFAVADEAIESRVIHSPRKKNPNDFEGVTTQKVCKGRKK